MQQNFCCVQKCLETNSECVKYTSFTLMLDYFLLLHRLVLVLPIIVGIFTGICFLMRELSDPEYTFTAVPYCTTLVSTST